MRRLLNIAIWIALSAICVHVCFGVYSNYRKAQEPKKVEYLPKGTVLAYQDFRGIRCPVVADGYGGQTLWIASVPWDKFTLDEKVNMSMRGGGHLNAKEMNEIWQRCGAVDQEPTGFWIEGPKKIKPNEPIEKESR